MYVMLYAVPVLFSVLVYIYYIYICHSFILLPYSVHLLIYLQIPFVLSHYSSLLSCKGYSIALNKRLVNANGSCMILQTSALLARLLHNVWNMKIGMKLSN